MDYAKEFEKYATKHKGVSSYILMNLPPFMEIIFLQLLLKKGK